MAFMSDDDLPKSDNQAYDIGNENALAGPASQNLYATIIASGVDALRAYASQIIPLFVCALLIPVVVAVSLLAGWLVWQNASVSWEAPLYLQYGDGVQPYAQISLPHLVSQQRYDISAQLAIPVTESNLALGNFMVSLTLSTPANKTLVSISRPAIILPPQGSFFSTKPGIITLEVPLLKAYPPGTSKLLAKFELGRRDSWTSLGKGEGREVSVLSAHIRGAVVHHGIRGLVAQFPLTSAILSTAGFLAMLSVALSICVLPSILRQNDRGDISMAPLGARPEEDEISTSSDEYITDGDDKLHRRSSSSSRHEEIKAEDETERESPRTRPKPLRRRMSRRTGRQSDTDS